MGGWKCEKHGTSYHSNCTGCKDAYSSNNLEDGMDLIYTPINANYRDAPPPLPMGKNWVRKTGCYCVLCYFMAVVVVFLLPLIAVQNGMYYVSIFLCIPLAVLAFCWFNYWWYRTCKVSGIPSGPEAMNCENTCCYPYFEDSNSGILCFCKSIRPARGQTQFACIQYLFCVGVTLLVFGICIYLALDDIYIANNPSTNSTLPINQISSTPSPYPSFILPQYQI